MIDRRKRVFLIDEVIETLVEKGPMTTRAIQDYLGSNPSTLKVILWRLRKEGIVCKLPLRAPERVELPPTKDGERRFRTVLRVLWDIEDRENLVGSA